MAKSKKGNPAEGFFSGVQEEFAIHTNNKHTHKQYTQTELPLIVQPTKETKTKRVNLVLQPSLYERAQAVARANGVSFNEMVTQLLKQVTATE